MRALLVVLLVLVGLAVVADRVGVGIAERAVAQRLADSGALSGTPEVDIRGFPFLTQAVAGRYDDVRISLTAAELGQPEGTTADVALRGVHVPLSDVLSGSVREVPVDRIDGTATLSYDLLSAQLGGDTTLRPEGDGLRITRTVELLGYTLPLTAAGTVTLDGDELVVDVENAAGAGVDVPGFLVTRVSDLLDIRYRVPALPFGLQLTGVQPADDGVVVQVEAEDAVLTPQ
jgi:LmeA-like phospholipid-binding